MQQFSVFVQNARVVLIYDGLGFRTLSQHAYKIFFFEHIADDAVKADQFVVATPYFVVSSHA